ncbi:MAG: response regulator [Roseburia sp.]|nr:response regulator [Roseburia sp.]
MSRNTILIVDDAEINRDLLKCIFEEQYEILEASNGMDAMKIIEAKKDELAVIFLDLVMPKATGLVVLEFMSLKGYMDSIPVIMITGEATAATDEKAYEYGASDIIYKPFDSKVVMRRTKNIVELFEHRRHIEQELEERTKALDESRKKLEKSNEFLVNALSSVVEFRSLESGEHIHRVKCYTKIMLKYVKKFYPEYELTKEKINLITNASALHDLGKIAIPDNILLKPGKLTEIEFREMKKHTLYGCELLEKFKQEDNEFYNYCYEICRWHHERYDGNGYPDKLKGEEIPIWAQVVSLADVYDALISPRVYKTPYAVKEAIRMIVEGECGVFSDKMLRCFDLAKEDFLNVTENELQFWDNHREEL